MAYKLIEANIESDLDRFTNLLNSNRTEKVNRRRFEWLYLDNPHGKARAWFMIDNNIGKPVAFTSVLPRLVKVANKNITCWNCCDFSVDKKYRTLGIALKLRRQAKTCVDNGEIQALYAHPNDRMKVVHDKVGHFNIGKMHRYVKLLSLNKQIANITNSKCITNLVAPVLNWCYNFTKTPTKLNKPFSVELLDNIEFTEEYDELFDKVVKNYHIIGHRGSNYLNWRYAANPLSYTRRFIIRKNGYLNGYIIFEVKNGVAVFKDILCVSDHTTMNILLSHWIEKMREEKIESISTGIMNKNPVISIFKKNGFRLRPDESSVYAYASKENELQHDWIDGSNWYMTVGDRDV